MSSWIVEKFDKHLHDRDSFSCSVEVLDTYLKTRANKEQENNLSVTYVATIPGKVNSLKPIIGYFTLTNHSLERDIMPPIIQKGVPISYKIPSILIGRLGVDTKYQKQGVGKLMLKSAAEKVVEIAALTAVKCISVTAKDESAARFYQEFGFTSLYDTNLLVLPLDTLLKATK